MTFGASVCGRPAGIIKLICSPADAARLPGYWTGGLYVRPLFRGMGVADALNGAAVDRATGRGADAVHVWTAPSNHRAIGAFAKAGFTVVRDAALEAQCRSFSGKEQLVLKLDLTVTAGETPVNGEDGEPSSPSAAGR